MIAPESVQAGDLVGIFSTDGLNFRGHIRVRELIGTGDDTQISFDGPLPYGTTQGDILCLIRRRDEIRILEARGVVPLNAQAPIAHDGVLYAPVQYSQIQAMERQIIQLQEQVRGQEVQLNSVRNENRLLNQRRYGIQALENNLATSYRANQALREALGSQQTQAVAAAIRIASDYRRAHEGQFLCFFRGGEDQRCRICRELDSLLESMPVEVAEPQPVSPRRIRRIKSSSDE